MSQDYFDHEGINASVLKCYIDEEFSPRKAVFNAKVKEQKGKECFLKGHTVHSLLENKGELGDNFIISPYSDYKKHEARDWKNDQIAMGNMPLKQKEYDECEKMAKMLWNFTPAEIKEVISSSSSLREEKIYTGEFKAMLDLYSMANKNIYDYKTTAQSTKARIINDAFKFKYHIQAYQYKHVAELGGFEVNDFYFIFVSSEAPYDNFVFKCTEDFMKRGEEDWNIALERFKQYHHLDYTTLDGAYTEVIDMDIPKWAVKDVELEWED